MRIKYFALFFMLIINISGQNVCASGIESDSQYNSATGYQKLEYWKKVAALVNKDVPFNIDETTVLKSVDALSDGLQYNIILVSPIYDRFQSQYDISNLLELLKQDSVSRQCARQDKFFSNIKARLKTVYHRKNGSYFGEYYYIAGEGCY